MFHLLQMERDERQDLFLISPTKGHTTRLLLEINSAINADACNYFC